jgi:hypothetical protein
VTTLGDKSADRPEVSLVRQSAPGLYRLPEVEELAEVELVAADDLTPEGDFPEYGEFLEVEVTGGGENPRITGTEFVECPSALARWVVENGEPGGWFRIRSVRKVDGAWQYDVETADPDVATGA